MFSKRVNNLCVQGKKRTENVPSGVPYLSNENSFHNHSNIQIHIFTVILISFECIRRCVFFLFCFVFFAFFFFFFFFFFCCCFLLLFLFVLFFCFVVVFFVVVVLLLFFHSTLKALNCTVANFSPKSTFVIFIQKKKKKKQLTKFKCHCPSRRKDVLHLSGFCAHDRSG